MAYIRFEILIWEEGLKSVLSFVMVSAYKHFIIVLCQEIKKYYRDNRLAN